MNIRGGLSSPQDNGFWFMGSWIPSAPENLIPPRSNPPTYVSYEYPFGRENWQSLAGTSNGYSQAIQKNNVVAQHSNLVDNIDRSRGHYGDLSETNQMVNYKGSSFQALLQSEGPGWNDEVEEFLTEDTDFVQSANRTMFPSLHSQGKRNFEDIDHILVNQKHQYYTSQSRNVENLPVKSNGFPQLDGNREHTFTKTMLPPPENHSLGSVLSSHSCNLLPQYEFLSSRKPNYDQSLEQRLRANAMPSKATSLHEAPIVSPSIMPGDQLLELLNFPIDEQSSHEKNKQEILITTIEDATQQQCDGLLQSIVDSSSAAISTLYPEMCESVKGDDQGIYLKETPSQKTPKRRKHRPKVITEGKPKRTPKPTITDQCTEKPSGKRKYVRRKGLNELATPPVDIKVTKYSTTEPAAKSCRRSLKFDAGNSIQSKQRDQETQERYKWGFDTLESLPLEFCTRGNDVCGTSSTLPIDQQDNFRVERMPSRQLSHGEMLKDYNSPTESKTAETQSFTSIEHNADSSHAIRRILEKENLDLYQNRYKPENALHMPQNFHLEAENRLPPSIVHNLVDNSDVIRRIAERENSDLCQNRSKPGHRDMNENFHLEAENRLPPSIVHNLDNSDVIRRIAEREDSDLCQNRSKPGHRDMNENFHVEAMWNIFNQTKDCYVQKKPTGIMLHNTQMVPKLLTNPFETRGWKRNYPYSIADACSRNAPRSQLLCRETRHADENPNGHNLCGSSLNISKKKKLESEMCANIGYSSLKVKTLSAKSLALDEFTSENRQGKINVLTGSTNGRNIKAMHWEKNFPNQPSELLLIAERMGKRQPSMSNVENPNLLPPSSLRKSPGDEQANIWKTSILKREQCTKPIVYQLDSSVLEKDQDGEFYYSFEQSKGSPADDLIWQMKSLDFNERPNDRGGQAQAIVPYNGFHEIVPYVGSNFIKKRIPRPKVDLDPDTERVWNLLMGKEGSEGLKTDKEKEKWWEEEREVFRGRADSFIARMHLVQGDRRFSRWKGSVIDSVVGVFLTQNVSDHLSSSAFMSMASRYPPKENINSRVSNEDGTNILIHEPDISLITSDDSTLWCKQVMDEQSFSRPQYSTKHQRDAPTSEGAKSTIETQRQNVEEEVISSQDSDSSVTQCLGIRSCSGSNSEAEDCPTGYTSIKNYGPDSKNSQTVSKTTYSEFHGHVLGNSNFDEIPRSRPEVDKIQGAPSSGLDKIDKIYGWPDLNTPPTNNDSQPTQGSDAPTYTHVLPVIPDTGMLEIEGCETFGEESTYSWPSISSELAMSKDLTCLSFGELGKHISRNTELQNGLPGSQETPCISIQSISEHTAQTSCVSTQSEFHMGRHKLSPHQQLERNNIFQSESSSFVKPSKASEDKPVCSGQSVHVPEHTIKINKVAEIPKENNQSPSANGLFGPNSNEHSHSSLKTYEGDAKISKIKGKAGKERNISVDWDNLRKQVLANGAKKERSKDTMDSVDYEAVRLADVSEIAETIKERGMNNLLAERIKDFLNRVLEEHGSIDLEWLRDVPPDKAKDYLLSIRGIGLKSVECVRLLTLHHLAFPVDTNVGRIAVRLGWVPLQPLPESLQLHLLELYPVLESIQKFLWPRLCQLDQRTLYELHYQLITFGKVFCTKSKPNCNACPMRGECRHFASAFASARLALPGPEERGIVSSTNQIPSTVPHAVGINPMPLLIETGQESTKCEPIIEVPLTPEQECTETCGSDIEDSLFEDPDDIPIIKLDIEELRMTLQNFIPEGDMSKALVALNSAAASIPTPKLKNVSRLRTEHQVYELPDSHPLLVGMDKREPDDPSPYLLAIWKPGETADSFELEGKSCESQDTDRLCNGETCFSCNSIKEANSQTVRGTILVPCRTAMRGSFPLNGTYFQVNEVFADHESSHKPIAVPRVWIWNLPRRTVYFGTSVTTIFKGLSTEGIQYCFWRGFVCVRGFDQKTRAPRPLSARLHFPASKLTKTKSENKK